MHSIADVVHVDHIRGQDADNDVPDLLIEVPHGADRKAHFDALRGRLKGDLPEQLEHFFFINTDVGAWALAQQTASRVLRRDPTRSVLLIRCLIPRTFIDANRPPLFTGGDLGKGGLTAGLHAYVRHDADRRLLLDLHRRYVETVADAFEWVCGNGGRAVLPHTYGPRSMPIKTIDDDIVARLHACVAEEETLPLRAEIDLLTRDGEGTLWAPEGLEERLIEDFSAAGYTPVANDTYCLHPASLGHRWSTRYPGQVLSFEVRRDLVVEQWTPFEEMHPDPDKIAPLSQIIAEALR